MICELGKTGCDSGHFSCYTGLIGRDASIIRAFDCVKECMGFMISNRLEHCFVIVYSVFI